MDGQPDAEATQREASSEREVVESVDLVLGVQFFVSSSFSAVRRAVSRSRPSHPLADALGSSAVFLGLLPKLLQALDVDQGPPVDRRPK